MNQNSLPITTKIAANVIGDQLALYAIPEVINRAIELGLKHYYLFTIYPPSRIADFATTDVDAANVFTTQVGATWSVYTDSRWPTSDFDWIAAKFPDAEYFMINQESQNSNQHSGPYDDAIGSIYSIPPVSPPYYSDLANTMMDYMSGIGWAAKPVADGSLVYTSNAAAVARRQDVQLIDGACVDCRQYIHIHPDIVHFTGNMTSNFALLETYFGTTLPGFLTDFVAFYPKMEHEAIIQFHVEDLAQTQYVSPYPLGNWAIGKVAEFILTNTDKFSYVAWMQFLNLIDDDYDPEAEFYSYQRVIPLFDFSRMCPYDFKIDGVTGLRVSKSDGSRALLINNSTSSSYVISHNSIFGAIGNFTRSTGWGESWGGENLYDDGVIETDILVRPYSSSVVYYNARVTLTRKSKPTC